MEHEINQPTANRQPTVAWPDVPLRELCEKHTGVRDPRPSPDTPFRYVDISSIDRITKTVSDARAVPGRDAPSRARKEIKTSDVLVSTTRPNLNAVALVPGNLDGQIASTGFCVLRAGERLDPGYLFAYVRSPVFVARLSDLVVGALYPAVTDRQVLEQSIPLPPLPEQKRIAAAVRKQLDAAARMRAAILLQTEAASALWKRHADHHFLGGDSAGLSTVPLGEICGRGQYGISTRSNPDGRGVPVLGMPNISIGHVKWTPLSHVDLPDDEMEKYRLKRGDLLFNRTNSAELVGKTAVFDGERDSVFASYVVRFSVDEMRAIPEYVCALINSTRGRRFVERHMTRAIGQVNISASTIAKLPVPLPPLSEQESVVNSLEAVGEAARRIQRSLEAQSSALASLDRVCLQRAFSGGP